MQLYALWPIKEIKMGDAPYYILIELKLDESGNITNEVMSALRAVKKLSENDSALERVIIIHLKKSKHKGVNYTVEDLEERIEFVCSDFAGPIKEVNVISSRTGPEASKAVEQIVGYRNKPALKHTSTSESAGWF